MEVGGNCVQFGVALSVDGNLLRQEVVVSEPLAPELEAKAQELAARIKARSADAILEMARRLVATTDESLFGDTEFALRDRAQGIVADAYACHLPQKRDTPLPQSTAPTAPDAPPFHGYREKTVETLGGPVTCNRALLLLRTLRPKAPAPGTSGSD